MIKFERYTHVNDFIAYYLDTLDDKEARGVVEAGVSSESDARLFSAFIWKMVEQIHKDEEQGVEVLGSNDNTDILPDIAYEVTNYMRAAGFYEIWEEVSEKNM